MVRLVPALLAVILLLSAPGFASLAGPEAATAQDGGTAEPSHPENTTSLLLLDDVQASNVTQPEPNLATTLSMQGSEMDGEFERDVVKRELPTLEGAEREEYAFIKAVRLRNEVESLLAEEQQAREAYIDGELTATEYLRTLARLHAQANTIRRPLGELLDEDGDELERQTGFIQSDLPILSGPILERTSSVVRGDASPTTVHVEVSPNGVVLSEVNGDTYVRGAYRRDRVNKDGLKPPLSEALDKMKSWYPWGVGEEYDGSASRFGPAAWEMPWAHEHASVTTYLYGNTSGPFREIQHKSLPDYPFNSTEETFGGDMVLRVNRTYAGGPMEVKLINQTGTPLDGEVRINGSAVGSTGDDGTLWLLQPEGSFAVVAVHEGERIPLELERATAEFVDES